MTIRPKAIAIIQHHDSYLFTKCYDEAANEEFYIPVGGGIEFGEYAVDAVRREIWEELNEEAVAIELLRVCENIFTYNGVKGHELVFISSAAFKDPAAYTRHLQAGINSEGEPIQLAWLSKEQLRSGGLVIYPGCLREILC